LAYTDDLLSLSREGVQWTVTHLPNEVRPIPVLPFVCRIAAGPSCVRACSVCGVECANFMLVTQDCPDVTIYEAAKFCQLLLKGNVRTFL
jgi:hypothetical protein